MDIFVIGEHTCGTSFLSKWKYLIRYKMKLKNLLILTLMLLNVMLILKKLDKEMTQSLICKNIKIQQKKKNK